MKIIYPVNRSVTEKEVRTWLADAIANDEVDTIGDESVNPQTVPLEIAIQLLDNTGKFTFERV